MSRLFARRLSSASIIAGKRNESVLCVALGLGSTGRWQGLDAVVVRALDAGLIEVVDGDLAVGAREVGDDLHGRLADRAAGGEHLHLSLAHLVVVLSLSAAASTKAFSHGQG